jgi:hypothetical protein
MAAQRSVACDSRGLISAGKLHRGAVLLRLCSSPAWRCRVWQRTLLWSRPLPGNPPRRPFAHVQRPHPGNGRSVHELANKSKHDADGYQVCGNHFHRWYFDGTSNGWEISRFIHKFFLMRKGCAIWDWPISCDPADSISVPQKRRGRSGLGPRASPLLVSVERGKTAPLSSPRIR